MFNRVYKYIISITPFLCNNPIFLFENILSCRYEIPDYIDINAKDIIKELLNLNVNERLNSNNIKSHPFFCDINWIELSKQTIKSPFIPKKNSNYYSNDKNDFLDDDLTDKEKYLFNIFDDFNPNLK